MATTKTCEFLTIDRSTPFNPAKFIGTGWSIWKGAKEGNGLEGEEQQDVRSLAITELDRSKLLFKDCLKNQERWIRGEKKLVRLNEGFPHLIRADAKIAQVLFKEPGHRTLEWIRVNLGKTRFDFPGTELRYPSGGRHILCLWWHDNQWFCRCSNLGLGWDADGLSLLLVS